MYEVVPGSAEEVEMGLLAGDERASSREGFGNGYADGLEGLEEEEGEGEEDGVVRAGGDGDGDGGTETATKVPLTREDKKAMALLIVLCASSSSISLGGSPPPTSSVTFSLIFSRHLPPYYFQLGLAMGACASSYIPPLLSRLVPRAR